MNYLLGSEATWSTHTHSLTDEISLISLLLLLGNSITISLLFKCLLSGHVLLKRRSPEAITL